MLVRIIIVQDITLMEKTIGKRILTIITVLSMFKFIYTFIGEKSKISDKTLLIIRIILPIVLLIIVSSIYPAT